MNGFLVSGLLDLKAVEHKAVMEQAHRRCCVNLSICGDWEEVQVQLGLKSRPRPNPEQSRDKLRNAITGVIDPRR